MPTTPPASRVLSAAVTAAATTAYYATPDLIRSRTRRGWTKTALAVLITTLGVPDARRAWAEAAARADVGPADLEAAVLRAASLETRGAPDARQEGGELDVLAPDAAPDDPAAPRASARQRGAAALAGTAALAGSVALTVAAERAVFRRGERRRAAGVPWAHTRAAVLWGLAAGALALLPDADERRAADAA
jgi:hypothetical protein